MTYKQLGSFYHHIDNGGIAVSFGAHIDGELAVPKIEFATRYHGYTAVSSSIEGHELTPEVIRAIGMKFISFAENLETLQKEQSEHV